MRTTYQIYKHNNGLYWGAFGLIWLILFLFNIEHSITDTHYLLNGYHAPWLDTFFKYYTYVGGGFPFYLGAVWLFFNLKQGSYILLTQALANIIAQIIKYFTYFARPYTLFENLNMPLPPTVEGVELWKGYGSFPSGHTTAIFALFTALAALTPHKYRYLQLLWLFLGFLGAYSRIYLSQHLLRDILLGSLIGAVSAFVVYLLLYKKDWGNYGIIKGIRLLKEKKQNNEAK